MRVAVFAILSLLAGFILGVVTALLGNKIFRLGSTIDGAMLLALAATLCFVMVIMTANTLILRRLVQRWSEYLTRPNLLDGQRGGAMTAPGSSSAEPEVSTHLGFPAPGRDSVGPTVVSTPGLPEQEWERRTPHSGSSSQDLDRADRSYSLQASGSGSSALANSGHNAPLPQAQSASDGGRSGGFWNSYMHEAESLAPSASAPDPFWTQQLIDAWNDYRENGDGYFNPQGLQEQLRQRGIEARVVAGSELGVGPRLVAVTDVCPDRYYLLPDFTGPLTAVTRWFEDQGSGDRTRRVTRVTKLAILSRRGDEPLVEKGAVS